MPTGTLFSGQPVLGSTTRCVTVRASGSTTTRFTVPHGPSSHDACAPMVKDCLRHGHPSARQACLYSQGARQFAARPLCTCWSARVGFAARPLCTCRSARVGFRRAAARGKPKPGASRGRPRVARSLTHAQLLSAAAELVIEPLSVGMWLTARRDLRDRVEAP